MNGIHLNDIPMGLFMDYFNKTNLRPKSFTQKYTTPVVYEYEFTIGGSGAFFYRSSEEFDFATDLTKELDLYFADLGGSNNYGTPTATIITTGLYVDSNLNFVTGHKYRFIDVSEDVWPFINLSVDLSRSVPTEFTMVDNRNQTTLIDLVNPLTATWDRINQRWSIVNSVATPVGYIYENTVFQMPALDVNDNKIYIDQYGRETTQDLEVDQFTRHNKAIRSAYSKIIEYDGSNLGFNREVIGIIDNASRGKSLAYYEEYARVDTYTRLDPATNPVPDEYRYIDRSIVRENPGEIYEDPDKNKSDYPIKTVLSMDLLKNVRVTETTDEWIELTVTSDTEPATPEENDYWIDTGVLKNYNGTDWDTILSVTTQELAPAAPAYDAYWIDLDDRLYQYKETSFKAIDNVYSNDGETVILDVNKRTVNLFDRDIDVPKDTYSDVSYFEIVTVGFRTYMKVRVTKETNADTVRYKILFKTAPGSTSARYSKPKFNGDDVITIYEIPYVVQKDTDLVYEDGYILVPAVFEYTHIHDLFGATVDINQRSPRDYILGKYEAPLQSSFEALETEEAAATVIIKDIYDNNIFLERTTSYTKVAKDANTGDFAEFIDWEHVRGATGTIVNVKDNTIELRRSTPITTYRPTIEDFYSQFIEHNKTIGYEVGSLTQTRESVVNGNIIKVMRLDAIKELSGVFMEKRYDDFLFYDSDMIFSENSLTNMRIFSEGYVKMLEKDASLFELPVVKKEIIDYTDVSPRIIIGDIDTEVTGILSKTYTKSTPYVLDKLSYENTFTKLLDYETFSTDSARRKYLEDTSKRLKAYADYSQITSARDIVTPITRVYSQNLPSKLDFKNFLIYNLFQNFYKYSVYDATGNAFTDNYATFYKNKLSDIEPNYMKSVSSTGYEKLVYVKEATIDMDDLLEKILVDEWSVL